MKKYLIMCAAAAVTLSFTSCSLFKSGGKESAYKKAYEKALAAENNATANNTITEVPTTTIEEIPVAPVVQNNNYESTPDYSESIPVRQEKYSMVDGQGLKAYSVVVGAFGVKANAERLQQTLRNNGYNAQIVLNERNLYRVVAATADSKKDAAADLSRLRSQYSDAWILAK